MEVDSINSWKLTSSSSQSLDDKDACVCRCLSDTSEIDFFEQVYVDDNRQLFTLSVLVIELMENSSHFQFKHDVHSSAKLDLAMCVMRPRLIL